jgi:hypothetical protein
MCRRDRFPFADEDNLRQVDDAVLSAEHERVFQKVFDSNGLERMVLGVGLLKPIEAEMRRRGLEAEFWTDEHRQRSDEAFRERPEQGERF